MAEKIVIMSTTSSSTDSTTHASVTMSVTDTSKQSSSSSVSVDVAIGTSISDESLSVSDVKGPKIKKGKGAKVSGKGKGKTKAVVVGETSSSVAADFELSDNVDVEFHSISSLTSDDEYGLLAAADEISSYEGKGFNVALGLVHSSAWGILVTFFVFLSLILQDVSIIFFPREIDVYINFFYILFTFFFVFEFVILVIFQEGYLSPVNTVFWLDIISVFSMVVDCIPLDIYGREQSTESNLLTNFITAARIFRILRLWRIFRVVGLIDTFNFLNYH
eukprot:TRINITY_DN3010_c1_g3_i1.p2 TRINITY_DN3010_c1_g3~~TRINITY_DN3010_c1_g3_i1.p2  ORF type:complete len:276 (-),score=62.25 TRINITY_DN3010_c1_g3_i1:13-840(-)